MAIFAFFLVALLFGVLILLCYLCYIIVKRFFARRKYCIMLKERLEDSRKTEEVSNDT